VERVKHKYPEILVFLIVRSRKWCKEFGEQGQEAFPGKGHQIAIEEEMRKLKREIEILRQERDILKKAVSIFAQPHP
jgi:transposase-like protein